MRLLGPMVSLALLAAPALAQQPETTAIRQPATPPADPPATPIPQRYRSVSVKPGEKCPTAVGDEVVVCATLDEPYRIPKQLRQSTEIAAVNQSWVNRAATMDEVGRIAGGLPDTCSPVGTGGQSGCALQAMHAWAAERREMQSEAASIP